MRKRISNLFIFLLVLSICTVPVLALEESEAQAQVDAVGREAVSGNLLVWFFCAIAFLKVSRKIDSLLNAIGIQTGHTGSSLLAEAMVAVRSAVFAKTIAGKALGGFGGAGHTSGNEGILSGGLSGIVERSLNKGGIRNATGASAGGVGGKFYESSLAEGGSFANRVIGSVAAGRSSAGSISGEKATAALMSYLGYTALGPDAADVPSYSDVEIGGGRITATEVSAEHPEGIPMRMYHAGQYHAPEGNYTKVTTADGASWYKQYAVDTIQRTPYHAEDGSIAYHESIVKTLPQAPPRKDSGK